MADNGSSNRHGNTGQRSNSHRRGRGNHRRAANSHHNHGHYNSNHNHNEAASHHVEHTRHSDHTRPTVTDVRTSTSTTTPSSACTEHFTQLEKTLSRVVFVCALEPVTLSLLPPAFDWTTVAGVFCVPLRAGTDSSPEVLLGKEKGGQYRGCYSFIGGKSEVARQIGAGNGHQRIQHAKQTVLTQLYNEILEEARLVADGDLFARHVLGVLQAPHPDGLRVTLLFVVDAAALGGAYNANPSAAYRQAKELDHQAPGRYREMTDLKWVGLAGPAADLASTSAFVQTYAQAVAAVPRSTQTQQPAVADVQDHSTRISKLMVMLKRPGNGNVPPPSLGVWVCHPASQLVKPDNEVEPDNEELYAINEDCDSPFDKNVDSDQQLRLMQRLMSLV